MNNSRLSCADLDKESLSQVVEVVEAGSSVGGMSVGDFLSSKANFFGETFPSGGDVCLVGAFASVGETLCFRCAGDERLRPDFFRSLIRPECGDEMTELFELSFGEEGGDEEVSQSDKVPSFISELILSPVSSLFDDVILCSK